MQKKGNVLIVCSTFPPESDVGGLRPAMFSKYLSTHGWRPLILTCVRPDNDFFLKPIMRIYDLPPSEDRYEVTFGVTDQERAVSGRSFLKKVKHFFYPDFSHPPGFVDKMLSQWPKYLSAIKFDVILATSPDLGCLTVAHDIAKSRNIPWIADFRDIVAQDRAGNIRERLLHLRMNMRRNKIIKSASAIITVSSHHAQVLAKSFGREVAVIENGYDPTLFFPLQDHRSKCFTIVYIGRILSEWLRNPKPLFEALDILIKGDAVEPKNLEVLFYGTEPELLHEILLSYECKNIVRCMPRVSYEEVPDILQKGCILLTLTNRGRLGILTTKVFEYLAVRRPILCVPGDGGELDALISTTGAGVSCPDAKSIVVVLKKWIEEWQKTGTVACHSVENETRKYSREEQTKQLAEILDGIVVP